jgi:hypothetical protein
MPTLTIYLTEESYRYLDQKAPNNRASALGKSIIEEWLKGQKDKEVKT